MDYQSKEEIFMEENSEYLSNLYYVIKDKYYYFLDDLELYKLTHFIVDNRFGEYISPKIDNNRKLKNFEKEYEMEIDGTYNCLAKLKFNINIDDWIAFCYINF